MIDVDEAHNGDHGDQNRRDQADAPDPGLFQREFNGSGRFDMGDDLPDICCLKIVGLPSCPNDAVEEVQKYADFISSKNGGRGAVRELCDIILKATGKYDDIVGSIINKE